jgi:hypothetical protein
LDASSGELTMPRCWPSPARLRCSWAWRHDGQNGSITDRIGTIEVREPSYGKLLMASFKKTIATARTKIAKAEIEAFKARLEAVDVILEGATPHDVLTLCAHALAMIVPDCCEAHQDEFKAEFLRVLNECVTARQEVEAAEAADDDEGVHQVH